MRNFILVALMFHLLVITVTEINNNYEFGDIISFPRKCARVNKAYKHFAVYVGTNNLFGQGDMDIFHRIRNRQSADSNYCVFGSLKDESTHQKENYLDGKLTPSKKTEIIKHIKVMNTKEICGDYNLRSNNCEHLATYVRYGKAYVKQPGTKAGYFLKWTSGKKVPKADEAMESISGEEVTKILDELNKNSQAEDECKE